MTVVCGTSVSVWGAGKQAHYMGWQADQLTFAGEADIQLLGASAEDLAAAVQAGEERP
jgi:hypothetical protein